LRTAHEDEESGIVVYQEPEGDALVAANTRFTFLVNTPLESEKGEVFALFKYNLPKNPYPLAMRLDAILPSGERRRLLTVEYSGGELSVPYSLPPQSIIILSMLNREIHQETVMAQ
jgi:hypothetical protein